MAILYINTGTGSNSGNGDTLRTAFNKINSNFSLLAGNLQSVIPTAAGENGNYLSSDGTNVVWTAPQLDRLISGTSTVTLSTSGILTIPSGGGITIGGIPPGSVIPIGPTPPSSPIVGQLWFDTVSARMYIFYESSWIDSSPK